MGAVFSVSFMFIICDPLAGYKIFGWHFLSLNIFNMLHYLFWNKVWRQLFLSHHDLIFWLDTQMIFFFLVMTRSLRIYLDISHSGLIFLGSIKSLFPKENFLKSLLFKFKLLLNFHCFFLPCVSSTIYGLFICLFTFYIHHFLFGSLDLLELLSFSPIVYF